MNTATVIGRAGQDAEIRYFESGKVKTTFSLAVGRWDPKLKEETTEEIVFSSSFSSICPLAINIILLTSALIALK